MEKTSRNEYLGMGTNVVENVSHPIYLVRKYRGKGGFVRLNTNTISENIVQLLDLSVNAYRLIYVIIELLKEGRYKTDVVFLTLGSIEKYYESKGMTYKGGKSGLAKAINELIEIKIIKRFPEAGRGAYQVNMDWIGFGSMEK